MLGRTDDNTTRKESSMNEIQRIAQAMDLGFELTKREPACDRCGSPGEFRGGTCYGCIRTVQELERIRDQVAAVRQTLAPGMEEHAKAVLGQVEAQLNELAKGV